MKILYFPGLTEGMFLPDKPSKINYFKKNRYFLTIFNDSLLTIGNYRLNLYQICTQAA